jgi:hypothetical protein
MASSQTAWRRWSASDQVLAHGISTAFQLAAVFAALVLAVTLVVVRARTLQGSP